MNGDMRPVLVDKIASVAIQADLGQEIRVSPEIPCEEGVLIAVEVLNNKSRYNTIELTSGRMAEVKKGDVVVGALGHRKALFGYSGHLPTELKPGDIVQLLNLGGVIGICDSINPSHGEPFNCKVLGCVLDFPYLGQRVGVPARVATEPLKLDVPLDTHGVPVIAIAGTCMNSGKTAAACAIVSRLRHNGLIVDAFKSTGVALRRDILAMEDSGARHVAMFSDFGICATTSKNAPALTRCLLNELSDAKPDVIVFELGDGLLGAYGVEAILRDKDIVSKFSGVVLCANDPVGAWGGAKLLREEFGIEPTVISGPATDNQVGIDIIRERSNVAALNAMTSSAELGDFLQQAIGLGIPEPEGRRMSGTAPIPTIVLGGSGYVAGEFLRLIAGHPGLAVGGVVSSSQAGEPIAKTFPHLTPTFPTEQFVSLDAAIGKLGTAPKWLVLSAAPHGAAAGIIEKLLVAGTAAGVEVVVVDASADFRFADPAAYAAVYGHEHETPARLPEFTCAVPEHLARIDTPHAAHPGCFATTMLLGMVPLAALGLADHFHVSAVTGSTGAGRTPRDTTHHPLRQSNLFAYQALKHRHDPEVRALVKAATGRDVGLSFVPHSGPFARGIHATIFVQAKERVSQTQVNEALRAFYKGSKFVRVDAEPPKMKDIAATNYAALHAVVQGDTIVVCSVADNLLKGAAGGSLQWANRLLGFPEETGLNLAPAGWL